MRRFFMSISYNKFWKLLIDKQISASELRKNVNIAPNTMTKLRKNQSVSLSVLERICEHLNCDFGDLVEYVPNQIANKDGDL